jgi:hypothetical protein
MLQLDFSGSYYSLFLTQHPHKWEVNSRVVSKVHPDLGLIGKLVMQANGSDERVIERLGGDIRIIL